MKESNNTPKAKETAYRIPELNATIFASSQEEFERKRAKLLSRSARFVTGGLSKTVKQINDYL